MIEREIIYNTNTLFSYYTLIIVGVLLTFVVLLHMLYHRRTPSSIMAWLLSIILIPYIAIFLYFIIGSRKRKNRYKKSSLILKNQTTDVNIQNSIDGVLRNYGIADASKNREFKLLFDTVETYNELLNCINNAKKSIYLSVYIFEYDKVTKEILKALIKKAKDGF